MGRPLPRVPGLGHARRGRRVVRPAVSAGPVSAAPVRSANSTSTLAQARPTGVDEFDRVLGGGLVPGSVVLLAGEPGVGKSTLLLEVARHFATREQRPALIVTGEESTAQVRLRAERTGALHPTLFLAAENDLGAVLTHIDEVDPGLLVVDSIQTIATTAIDSSAGGVTQIRASAAALIDVAKQRGLATVLVGHVTKDGSVAGPRVLEHLVDVVLLLRGRPALVAAADPRDEEPLRRGRRDRLLRDARGRHRRAARPVRAVPVRPARRRARHLRRRSCSRGGARWSPRCRRWSARLAGGGTPRRSLAGLDSARVAMLLAGLDRHCGIRLGEYEVYAATVGGIAATEPAADLAIALALASDRRDVALPPGLCAIGEVSLSGDVRRVSGLERRLSDAARLGFHTALVPPPPRGEPAATTDLGRHPGDPGGDAQ